MVGLFFVNYTLEPPAVLFSGLECDSHCEMYWRKSSCNHISLRQVNAGIELVF
jgi:hypothetical protein